ncbi:MAG: ATP-dependent Clp protease proteolytic subunit, partial [Candidatus Omnitrophica bacterium]|nr:ATP-dependent Clp protease proteolytic subunit [Candidatus Omnitrophota bacterium]
MDLGLSGFIKRSVEEAKKSDAKAVIFELDTPGGRVDAAEEILEYIRSLKPILTIAFINDEASSAGAFISFGCDKIVMAPGSSIGSAEPRTSIGPTSEGTDEK